MRSPSASNLPPIDPLTGQSSGPLKTSGLSPRFRDSSKRYRNLPKRSERSLLRLLPPLILIRVSFSRLLAASCRFFARASALASPAAGLFRLLLPSLRFAFRLRFPSVDLGFARVWIPQSSFHLLAFTSRLPPSNFISSASSSTLASLPRKEVIQPHLPIRLPCYDFTPVIGLTFDGCPLSVSSPASGAPNSHGVTGGVYKARERIHRGMLIRDY